MTMAEITSDLVKRLRDMTGAGMMDCKKALGETGGDIDGAVDYLRKKGIAKAGSKAGRVAAQGLVTVAVENGKGAVVEVNSETDFVARNEKFQDFVKGVSQLALKSGSVEDLAKKPFPGGSGSVADKLTDLIATIGAPMSLRRMAAVSATPGVVAAYVHSALPLTWQDRRSGGAGVQRRPGQAGGVNNWPCISLPTRGTDVGSRAAAAIERERPCCRRPPRHPASRSR
jgi:elongation factor Ts